MTDEKLSEVIMKNLYAEATSLPRPEVRKNTLDRLKMACDAIIDGSAKDVIAKEIPIAVEASILSNPKPFAPL